ncbi:MAG TPA: hypothetical protein VHA56_22220 [Mucilaginibacter sp.]|nr:hypothetical protein [Mucilaginibacter sp.]
MRGDFHVRFCERFMVRFHLPTRLSQKKTQKKYLLEQIAALQVYLDYARKGYQIAGSGWSAVRSITGGEFSLHDLMISGLKKVSPAVRNDARVAEIIGLETGILKAWGGLAGSRLFTGDRLDYLSSVRAKVNSDCLNDLGELLLVITSGKAEMNDDERLGRLSGIYERMRDKAEFTQGFTEQALLLGRQSVAEAQSINQLRRYYESH